MAVAVVGGGPAGLMAAEVLATAGVAVTVYERMPSVGRKFLLAGRGGLNLTHSEPLDAFLDRYGPARPRLAAAIEAFGPTELRAWATGLGEEPFVGSSGRVFPAGFRATPLLRAWLRRLDSLGVEIRTRSTWTGWAAAPGAAAGDGSADATVLALGGASWPRVGSDGAWVDTMAADDIDVVPLRPANCGFVVSWSDTFRTRFAGTPLKNIALSFAGVTVRGDAMVTSTGIEGGAVYALSAALRDAIDAGNGAVLTVDLQPDLTDDALRERLGGGRERDSMSSALRRAGFPPVAIGLLREARLRGEQAKMVPIHLSSPQPISRAISSAGGISFAEIDDAFMLRKRPGTFVAGEMLDWEAPTGGYLLQATFSTAVAAANGALTWIS